MTQDKKILIEKIAVGALIAIFMVNIFITKKRQENGNVLPSERYESGHTFSEIEKKLNEASTKKITYSGTDFGNPMKKPPEIALIAREGLFDRISEVGGPINAQGDLTLEGIVTGPDKNTAIISGNVVEEGDLAGRAKVIKITENYVIILENGKQIKLER